MRGWNSVVTPITKRGGQEVLSGAESEWSQIEEHGAINKLGPEALFSKHDVKMGKPLISFKCYF